MSLLPETVLSPDRGELPIRLPENGATYKQMVEDYERRLILTALRRTGGIQKRAAELLKIKPTTLHEIIKRLEIRDEGRPRPMAASLPSVDGPPRPRPEAVPHAF